MQAGLRAPAQQRISSTAVAGARLVIPVMAWLAETNKISDAVAGMTLMDNLRINSRDSIDRFVGHQSSYTSEMIGEDIMSPRRRIRPAQLHGSETAELGNCDNWRAILTTDRTHHDTRRFNNNDELSGNRIRRNSFGRESPRDLGNVIASRLKLAQQHRRHAIRYNSLER